MKIININKKKYQVCKSEFIEIKHPIYNTLKIFDDVSTLETISSFIIDLSKDLEFSSILFINPTHGGFMCFECSDEIESVYYYFTDENDHLKNINYNIKLHRSKNILNYKQDELPMIVFGNVEEIPITHQLHSRIIISHDTYFSEYHTHYTFLNFNVYIPNSVKESFYDSFRYYIFNNNINYENLINLCIMVKDAGDQFENVLKDNLHFIDRWTILDTGSTDNTVSIIRKVLKDKKGELYQEPFINFRDSRNRLLDLAGYSCKYIVMLDDTYVIKGDMRGFLRTIRGDQFGDSYAIYIKDDESTTRYISNRVLKSKNNLRYIHRIHEVIQNENNSQVTIPFDDCWLVDRNTDDLRVRSQVRNREMDLRFLNEELEENPHDPRTMYYLGQTYRNMNIPDKAFQWYLKRAFHTSGLFEERLDAISEAARIGYEHLKLPWENSEKLYMMAHQMDGKKPDYLYHIAMYYYKNNDDQKAFEFFKKAQQVGFSEDTQYNVKPYIYYNHLQIYLAFLSLKLKKYEDGYQCCKIYLSKNDKNEEYYSDMCDLMRVFKIGSEMSEPKHISFIKEKKMACMYVSKMNDYYENIKKSLEQYYDVFIFSHEAEYVHFLRTNHIHVSIIVDNIVYLPVNYECYVENVFLFLEKNINHKTFVYYDNIKLKNVFVFENVEYDFFNKKETALKSNIVSTYMYPMQSYLNKYHWCDFHTTNVPFLNTLRTVNEDFKLLELGAYTGCSVMKIKELLPKSTVIALVQSNYKSAHQVCLENVKNIDNLYIYLSENITKDLINIKVKFDMIHINIVDNCDFIPLFKNSFDLLEKGGVLAVNYFSKYSNCECEYLTKWIVEFLTKNIEKIEILEKSHYIIIRKIS